MRINANDIATREALQASVCVIGAGAAGISLALELARNGVDVCLLESGGDTFDAATQDLYVGEVSGRGYYPLNTCRLRWLGGTTNHWSGHCPELEAHVFERRAWIDDIAWPFGREALADYYGRAATLLDVTAPKFSPTPEAADALRRSLPLGPSRLQTRVLRFSPPARMGTLHGAELSRLATLRLILKASVVRIQRARGAREIESVHVKTLAGRSIVVKAREFVLATGGIENARLLLASNDVETAGLGNAHDLVGRHFMDQLLLPDAARWLLGADPPAIDLYRWPEGGARGGAVGVLGIAPAAAAAERLGDLMLRLNWSSEARESEGWNSLREIRSERAKGKWPQDLGDALWKVLADLDDVAVASYEEIAGLGEGAFANLLAEAEQRPDPANRVTLSDERDALGLPRVRLHWNIAAEDFRTLERGIWLAALAIGEAGLGRVQLRLDEAWRDRVTGAFHHLGTTRMADSPARGVVDAQCRVHGLANLWVAGSSVFPTGGAANPTVTLVALAVRLADELRRRVSA
jgi:choline dehydrogenase-like flavoprotein